MSFFPYLLAMVEMGAPPAVGTLSRETQDAGEYKFVPPTPGLSPSKKHKCHAE